ncbi:hypothetical protein IGI66_002511 [Enterococcus sp. AZ048]|uniref:energy-coupling factor transporter transmembrane component T family protein n=1 Tax=Enterococcus sp. AZ048 TaxID=2774658 RepID=UPI003F217A48
MPDWLTSQNEDALLLDKKNSFLMKNQKGLLFILEKFDHGSERSAASAIHPSLRFLSTLALLLIVSLSQKMLVLWICGLYIFSGLLFFSQKDLKKILGKSVLLSAMPFLIYLPSLLLHQGTFLFLIRVPLIACLISQYTETATTYELLSLLKRWYLPNIVLFQLDITIKYIYILAKVMVHMMKGISARHVGNQQVKLYLGTNVIALIYLRSLDYGKKLQQAMEARGFNGTYPTHKLALKKIDYVYILTQVMLLFVLFFIGKV